MLIGINNISRPDCDYDERETLEELIEKLKEFINKIVSNPSRLLVQSIYPTKYPERINNIKLVNEQLATYCNNIGVEYIDIYNLLKNDEELIDKKYSDDGIHPNETGYNLIAQEINKKLKKNLVKKLTNR